MPLQATYSQHATKDVGPYPKAKLGLYSFLSSTANNNNTCGSSQRSNQRLQVQVRAISFCKTYSITVWRIKLMLNNKSFNEHKFQVYKTKVVLNLFIKFRKQVLQCKRGLKLRCLGVGLVKQNSVMQTLQTIQAYKSQVSISCRLIQATF